MSGGEHVGAFDVSCSCGWASFGHYGGAEADRALEEHEREAAHKAALAEREGQHHG